MKLILLSFYFLSFSVIAQEGDTLDLKIEPAEVICFCESEPLFPGGNNAMNRYIKDRIDFQLLSQLPGDTYTVYVDFTIDENGTVDSINVRNVDEIAIRNQIYAVFDGMPNWIPGWIGNEVPVSYRVRIPIRVQMGDPRNTH